MAHTFKSTISLTSFLLLSTAVMGMEQEDKRNREIHQNENTTPWPNTVGENKQQDISENDPVYLNKMADAFYNEENYKEAFEYYFKSADGGNTDAMYNIGYMYYNGEGAPQDWIKAYRWIQKAAEMGNVDAMNKLGCMYYYGEGVSQDYEKALACLIQAANLGNATAMYSIGYMYYQGEGTPQDWIKAYRWIQKAEEMGNDFAKNFLQKYNMEKDLLHWNTILMNKSTPKGTGKK